MLAVNRRQSIFDLLQERGSVTVVELSRRFEVSEETIRRDLPKMEASGLLSKTYGGAFINAGMHLEVPVAMREHTRVEAKSRIAAICANLVHNGDTIFLDGSSTSVRIAESILDKKNLIVLTNAIRVAETLSRSTSMKVILTGGTLRPTTLTMVGKAAENAVLNYFADKAFICCDGVHRQHGITDANEKEAVVRQAMMRRAESSILVADASKFNKTSFVHLADFAEFAVVVTDEALDEDWQQVMIEHDVEYRYTSGLTGGPAREQVS
jgi:DeoR/GlpR family transcriptional regulator of sugar metabolism